MPKPHSQPCLFPPPPPPQGLGSSVLEVRAIALDTIAKAAKVTA